MINNNNYNLINFVLKTLFVPESHSAENTANRIRDIFKEF